MEEEKESNVDFLLNSGKKNQKHKVMAGPAV
jgi:hypothetical protein